MDQIKLNTIIILLAYSLSTCTRSQFIVYIDAFLVVKLKPVLLTVAVVDYFPFLTIFLYSLFSLLFLLPCLYANKQSC